MARFNTIIPVLFLTFVSLSANEKLVKLSSSVVSSGKLGKIELLHGTQGFVVEKEGQLVRVYDYDTDSILRKISPEKFAQYLTAGKLHVSQFDNGDYSVKTLGGLKGGGPIAGAIGYWVVKSLGYGAVATTATVAVTAVAVGTGGAGVVAAGAVGAAGSVAGAAAGGMAAGAAAAGISTVVTAVGGAGAVSAATLAVAANGVPVVAVIEAASASTGAALTLCPFLP